MRACCVHLHWTPDQFWKSTPHELVAIFEEEESGFSKLFDSIPEQG